MSLSKIIAGASILLALVGCAGNGSSTLLGPQLAEIAKIDTALKLVADKQFQRAEGVIQPVIHAKKFNRLPSAEQYRALLTAARLAYTLKKPQLEYESRVRLLALPEATSKDRVSRVNAAARLQNLNEVLVSLLDLVQKNPELLDDSTGQFVARALNEAQKTLPHGASLPLLQALYATHWKLEWNQEPSGAWLNLAQLLLEQKRVAEAIEVSSHITEAFTLIQMRVDRRFDAVTTANPAHFDVDSALKHDLDNMQSAAERAPKSLGPRLITLELLFEQQNFATALKVADGALAEIRSKSDPRQWYDDFDEQYVWILDTRSRVLRRLGRRDEGLDQLAAASWVLDRGGENVNQVINLGDLYCDLGKPKEALGALTRLGKNISPYGRMQEASVRLDAAIQLGDAEQTQRWLEFMKDHRSDAPRTYQDALLLHNDFDVAAQWLIERLEDKDLRALALLSVQEYADHLTTRRQAELQRRTRALVARPDVQVAIQKVGRIEKYDIEALGQ